MGGDDAAEPGWETATVMVEVGPTTAWTADIGETAACCEMAAARELAPAGGAVALSREKEWAAAGETERDSGRAMDTAMVDGEPRAGGGIEKSGGKAGGDPCEPGWRLGATSGERSSGEPNGEVVCECEVPAEPWECGSEAMGGEPSRKDETAGTGSAQGADGARSRCTGGCSGLAAWLPPRASWKVRESSSS